eukprot:2059890-Lingulodinium_polyedra.AAC.1
MWLMGAGCGCGFIMKCVSEKFEQFVRHARAAVHFNTASGLVRTVDMVDLFAVEFGTHVEPY